MNDSICVMVVDDDPDVLPATSRMVRSLGYQVIEASNGTQCKTLLTSRIPDLILLDVMLPDLDGTDLCRDLKADPKFSKIYIVLTSGLKTSSFDQADGLEFGAEGYIARPISNREFKARIKAMVRILLAERERDLLIVELKAALSKVKRLSGLLPFCSYCKKIRDDKGYWQQIDEYIRTYSEAELGDSICPNCAKTYFPGLNIYQEEER
ncbi:response regulator [Desulfobacter postgatei]|uniref:response regulator transcription factor n=1 Tax=Desulfobacter postgatei TaxID=2293 RepID=UPI00259B6A49|nr:response regulator [uncultured Desulfobacter sp.]